MTAGNRWDVIVVGAGLAGLAAERRLLDRGARTLVLEARDRVGGRTLSHRLSAGFVVDLGAQWIGPGQDRVADLVKALGLTTLEQYCFGKKVLALGASVRTYASDIPSLPFLGLIDLGMNLRRLESLCRQVPIESPFAARKAEEWDGMTVETWKRRHVHTRGARALLDIGVRALFASEPSEVSLLHFLFYLHSGGGLLNLTTIHGGAQQTRLVPGCQEIARRLANDLGDRIAFESPVHAITEDPGGVTIHSDGRAFHGRFAILALSPALASRIRYEPPLSPRRDLLTQRMGLGSVIKCVAVYDRPFWRGHGFSGEAVSDTGPLTLTFDDSPPDTSHGALVGFILAREARAWGARSAEERRQAVLTSLTRFFGAEAGRPIEYVDHDWTAESWSRGCYVGLMPPGVQTGYGDALRTPSGRIHWAGTETATRWNGYMDGALESGARAADEVLARLAFRRPYSSP